MRALLAFALLGAPLPALADTPPAPVAMPDTPAGRFVGAWTQTYNSDDPAQVDKYNARYHRKSTIESWNSLYAMTGRLTPVKVEAKGPNEITVLFASELGDSFWQEQASIDPADPMKLVEGGFSQADRPPEFAIARVPHAELNRMMDAKLAKDVAGNRFAGTIMVERHGRIIYQAAAGLADRAAKTPVTMDTLFRIGSANKMFTAVSVLQLVGQGKISLDATVGTYLADYPDQDFAHTVTIRQLLSHTGGAGDIFTPEYDAQRLNVKTLADYVKLFGNRAPDTSKDGKTAYANYGFILLGRIIEVVSGEDYYSYVREHVFAPAGMVHTGSLPEDTAVPGRSHGYIRGRDGKLADNADTLPYRGTSAGGGYTTAADMIRFADALRSGKLLPGALLDEAISPQRPDGWYGFGFFIEGKGAARNWGHGGGAPGMNASFRVFPELDAVVVALANLDPAAADNEAEFYANRMALGE